MRSIAALTLLVALSACGPAGSGASSPSDKGTGASAADFTARDIDGKTVRLSDHLGKEVILLDFWATYCQPCLAEFPHLNKLYEANKAKGFVVLGVAMDGPETMSEVPSFARRNQVTFPIVLDEDSRIANLYNPRKSAPLAVLIDKTGKIRSIREGYNPGDEEGLAAEVAKVLDASK